MYYCRQMFYLHCFTPGFLKGGGTTPQGAFRDSWGALGLWQLRGGRSGANGGVYNIYL